MFGLAQRTPVITSITTLSAASIVGFGLNQFARADRDINHRYQDAPKHEDSQWQANFDAWDNGDDELKIASQQRVLDNLSSYSVRNDKRAVKPDADLPAVLELSSLDGNNGFQLNGILSGDRSGWSVSGAGDVNGDGYNDVIIGAYAAAPHDRSRAGESYVVFGKSSGFDTVELSSLDGSNGFQINGVSLSDNSGYSVSDAGDINADGYDDIIIGTDAEGAYVLFGKASGFDTVELSSLDGSAGFQMSGGGAGGSVSNAGDVNGDGYTDVIVGARYADPPGRFNAGESYVVFGKETGFGNINLESLDGNDGFQINGIASNDQSGCSVSGAGDVNRDGYSDVIIGAFRASPNGVSGAGESYVVFGKEIGFDTVELSSLDGSNGFQINGIARVDYSGYSVSGAGDVNGDGYDDVIIGAYYGGVEKGGEGYVVFGKEFGFGTIELSSLDGNNGFQIHKGYSSTQSTASVSGAGDVNADGYADVIIGDRFARDGMGNNVGISYVIFGKGSGFGAVIELSGLDGSNGFQINGISSSDWSGHSVSGAGDVNTDGYDDIVIGAYGADPHGKSYAGESYVVFGGISSIISPIPTPAPSLVPVPTNPIPVPAPLSVPFPNPIPARAPTRAPVPTATTAPVPAPSSVPFPNPIPVPAPTLAPVPTPTTAPLYPESINVSTLNGQTGSILLGANNRALMGGSVSQAGDVNIDGLDDVIVGASGTIVNGIFNAGTGYVVFGDRAGFPANTSVTQLTGQNGLSLVGASYEQAFAASVGGIGDVNHDGIGDVLIGSPYGVGESNLQTGKAYVVYGSRVSVSPLVNVTKLDGGNGFGIEGESYGDQLGSVVSGAGDINRDGTSDLMVSAPYVNVGGDIQAGKAYVVFGDYEGLPDILNVTALNGTNGFSITGENAFDHLGESLSSIGDMNGDGIDDIAIGAPEATVGNEFQAGKVYVVFGNRNGFSSVMPVSSLNGENGFSINGAGVIDNFGGSIAGIDINRDTLSDLIVGAPGAKNSVGINSGKVYVLFGREGGFLPEYNVSLLTPSDGFTLEGEQTGDKTGASVSGIGDFNADGVNDMLIGASQATVNGQPRAGKGYVVFGQRGGYPSTIALSSLDGNNGFTIEGEKFGDNLGSSVSGAGDMNQDGAPDILLGATGEDNGGTGYTALVYGGISLFPDARQGQSLRSQNTHTPNQPSLATKGIVSATEQALAFG